MCTQIQRTARLLIRNLCLLLLYYKKETCNRHKNKRGLGTRMVLFFLMLQFQETVCFSKLHLTVTWSNARTFFSSFSRFGYYSLLIPRISCPHWLFLLIECLFLFYEFWEAFVKSEEAFVQCLYKIARKHAPSNLYALYENLSKVWKKVRPEKSLLAFNFCCY